jgi:hypothetical protein
VWKQFVFRKVVAVEVMNVDDNHHDLSFVLQTPAVELMHCLAGLQANECVIKG